MAQTKNLRGQRFGRLKVVSFAGYESSSLGDYRHAAWRCRCDCGNLVVVSANMLRNGSKKSCGCLRKKYIDRKLPGFKYLYGKWKRERANSNLCEEWMEYEIFSLFMACVGYADGKRIKALDCSKVLSPSNFCFV